MCRASTRLTDSKSMGEIDIIELIKRRQAKFQAQYGSGQHGQRDEVAGLILEEYDSLLAEIEFCRSKSRDEIAIANTPKAERDNRTAEDEILGDQGQSGG